MTAYQFRAFAGPRYTEAGDPRHYRYPYLWEVPWDVSQTQRMVAATVGASDTTIALSGPPQGSRGGMYIGPNGTGEAWEYVEFASVAVGDVLTDCLREPTAAREHNGVHSSGALAYEWFPLTADTGRITLTEQLDDNLATVTWSADLAGVLAPQIALRAGHLIVVQRQALDPGSVGGWENWLIGVIRQPRIKDDYSKTRAWQLQIVSLAQVVEGYQAKAIRVGALDYAKTGSASSDTPLAWATKEAYSGEVIAADPDLSAAAAIDGNPATVWIAERYRGDVPALTYPANESDLYEGRFASGIRINRWPGEPKGHRYIEFLAPNTTYPNFFNNGHICCKWGGGATEINFDGVSLQAGELLIVCENQNLFEDANPLAEPVAVFEIGSGFFDALDPAGDAVALRIGGWFPTVAWGTGGRPYFGGEGGRSWDGPTITAPGPGQIIRYDPAGHTTNDASYFKTDYVDMAGYRGGGEDPWVQVTLPALGLQLRDDVTASAPGAGAKLHTVKAGSDSAEGLAESGTIQIGLEQITYSARETDGVIVSARGANSTTAAAHTAGDALRTVDTDGTATRGQLISSVGWSRSQEPYPSSFKIRLSNLDSARVPTDDSHEDDYETVAAVTGNTDAGYTVNLSPARWVTHVLIEIDHMTGSGPIRPRLNDIKIVADNAAFEFDLARPPSDAVTICGKVLTNAGIDAGALDLTTMGLTLDDLQTAEAESAWSVAADLAARTGVMINVQRAGTIVIAGNPLQGAALTAGTTITNVQAAAVEVVQTAAAAVGQVRQPYKLPDLTTGVVRYPTDPNPANGQIIEARENRYTSAGEALAAATRLYIRRRYSAQLVVTCAEPMPEMRPGTVVRVQWRLQDTMQQINRLGVVAAADHELDGGTWTTVLTVIQLDREWGG